MGAEAEMVTHIRGGDRRCVPLCGAVGRGVESLSLVHYQLAYMVERDLVEAYDSQKRMVLIDRQASVRDGIETLPHPLCRTCTRLAAGLPRAGFPSQGVRVR